MTDKKFTIDKDGITVIDNCTDELFECKYSNEAKLLCNLLNDLNDENEELKQSYTQLKYRQGLLHDQCIDAEYERDELKKENEQLKCEIELLQNSLDMQNGKKVKLE